MRLWRCAAGAVIVMAVVAGAGCGDHPRADDDLRIDRPGMVPVKKPNLASLSENGRLRVERRELLVMETMVRSEVSDLDLGGVLGELGMAYLAFGYPESAVGCFVNARTLADRDYRWPHYLTMAKMELGEAEGAIAAAEQALALRPASVPMLVLLGDASLQLGRWSDAKTAYSKAVELRPECAAAWCGLGQTALAQDDFRGSVDPLETALRLQPEATMVHYPLAMAYRSLGDLDRAEEHLRLHGIFRPAAYDPLKTALEALNVQAWIRRGTDLLQAGRYAEAELLLSKAIVLEPDDPNARINLGVAFVRLERPEEALLQYREALRLQPDSSTVHTHLGKLYGFLGRQEEAIRHLRRAIELNPADVRARFNLGQSLKSQGQDREALTHFEVVIQLDPRDERARAAAARTLASLGECEAAVESAEEGLALLDESTALAQVLARLLAGCPSSTTRDPVRALELATRAFEVEGSLENAVAVALAHGAVGNFESAMAWQQHALELLTDVQKAAPVRAKMTHDLELYRHRQVPEVDW